MDTAKPERGERALAADIGGTNARFALAEVASGKVRLTFRRTYPTWSFPDFEPALQAFLSEARAAGAIGRDVPRAAVAIAGAVDRHAGRLTNRAHWTFDLHALRAQLGVRVRRLHLRRHRGEACRALRRRRFHGGIQLQGRHSDIAASIAVRLVTNESLGLAGAALAAAEETES